MSFFRLAARAEKGGAPGLDQMLDGAAAAAAWFSLAAVHHEFHLEEARLTVAVQVVVYRGAALPDGPLEYAAGLVQHRLPGFETEGPCGGGRVDTGGEHDFAGINIAD